MENLIQLHNMNACAGRALTALFLGIAEAHRTITSNTGDDSEFYDVGRELGCALLGINDSVEDANIQDTRRKNVIELGTRYDGGTTEIFLCSYALPERFERYMTILELAGASATQHVFVKTLDQLSKLINNPYEMSDHLEDICWIQGFCVQGVFDLDTGEEIKVFVSFKLPETTS